MTGPVIDLGELRHGPDEDPLPRPPRANGRPLRCALVLLLVLVTVASAGLPPRRSMVTLPAQIAAETLLADDLFVVLDPNPAQPTQRRLNAFRLPGGEPAWQTTVPAEGRSWGIMSMAGTLLVTVFERTTTGQGVLSLAFDRKTGAYQWQQPGSPVRLADGNVLLQTGNEEEPVSLRAVDPCCGTVRWQLLDAAAQVSLRDSGYGADRVVLNQPDGSIEVRDASTGAVLARANLGVLGGRSPGFVQVINDLLLVIRESPTTITAYGLDRLDRRWSGTAGRVDFVQDCGPVLCWQTRSAGLRAVDPGTGQERWRSDRWAWVFPYDGRLVATLLNSTGTAVRQLVVLDPMTGRELAELGNWELAQFALGGPMIGVRQHQDGGLLVAELDVRTGEARLLDVLPDAAGNCQAAAGALLCQRVDGSYQLFEISD
ncbi:PQQ-binding-like beta-propeller repeat protein [Micromonospora arborensis]|uniref:outer membrane protein assembly factor BamB family protein n=1 Tax=Micromonospora arborensis TaxID=2116518 RepID=UPI0033C99068